MFYSLSLSFISFLLPFLTVSIPPQGTPAASADAPGTIVWSANRPLTWADFKTKPTPADRLAALTSATIDVQAGCVDFKFTSTVRAVFVPTESWVRDSATATPNLLRHEQLHFNITELHARRMRQKIALLKLDCKRLQPTFKNATKAIFAEWQKEEARYDQETNHGLNLDRQKTWEIQVKQRMALLEQYASKPTPAK
ncbi:hypothetical protein SAMN00120144_3487 [Hymenobacter roseosalivarius DSM 11622]|uniref:DUF922 domain-containing protein n=1 Tax=Hymenobacter roseosalivarius DSM 11622 TaxID=645990 RepID=A0A1W1VXY5_9BACT|nr:DUF922 domain-containing protein [Hymenobacter roseosalivarius]SMB98110.1 hypothetical protein SAMN00120144_3487 [Hymenobacter roseosalivarius DSM 11622]